MNERKRYQSMRHSIGEPDMFRLRYRRALIDCVSEAIRQTLVDSLSSLQF